jgi:hypothetical protein
MMLAHALNSQQWQQSLEHASLQQLLQGCPEEAYISVYFCLHSICLCHCCLLLVPVPNTCWSFMTSCLQLLLLLLLQAMH